MSGSPLLALQDVLNSDAMAVVPDWWGKLPAVGRARGRWVFHEPTGSPMPRQRTIYETPSVKLGPRQAQQVRATHAWSKGEGVFRELSGDHLEEWKRMVYKTTNQDMGHVQVPLARNADELWLRVMRKSHTSLLRPDAEQTLAHWARSGASERQREAFSELMWSLQDFITGKRGKTEYRREYTAKPLNGRASSLINPYYSSLGRPSSAPIAPPVHQALEQSRREQQAALMESHRTERPQTASLSRTQVDAFASKIPIKFPGAALVPRVSEAQAMQRSLSALDRIKALTDQSFSACPPASYLNRHIGQKEWHGDSMYPKLRAQALRSYPTVAYS